MTPMEQAANAAADALRNCGRSETGYVIAEIADEYGVDRSDLGRELNARRNSRRQKKEKVNTVKETVWLDMSKVKSLGCGGDLGKLARLCGLGHDTLRIADGREGKGVQRKTVRKIAETFGIYADDLLHEESRQISFTEISSRKNGQQDTASKKEAEERAAEGKTQGRKGCKQSRINMAFTTANYEFLVFMARATGKTITGFTNAIISAFRAEHDDLFNKAKAFLEALNDSAISEEVEA